MSIMTTPLIYADLFEQLEHHDVRYVVVSGVAVVLHGHARPIADLDIVIDPTPDQARHTMLTLTASGFVPTIPLPLDLLTMMRMFDQKNREVDVFIRYHIKFDRLWSESCRMRIGKSNVRVISLEHLISIKRLHGRPHDLQDVEGLLEMAKLQSGEGIRERSE
jgi:hypothetical protein